MTRNELRLHVLGSGGGASHAYHGDCSTSMVLCREDEPVVLIELGLGVTRACMRQFGKLPLHVVVSHNHTDHAGELPVVLRVESKAGRRLHVHAEQEVIRRLKTHRMAEHMDIVAPDELAEWHAAPAGSIRPLLDDLSLEFVPGVHSEHSCGFILRRGEQALFSYSGDSAQDEAMYRRLQEAPLAIYDARPSPSRWHASFEQIRTVLRPGDGILGHGMKRDDASSGLPLLFAGDIMVLEQG